MTVLCSSCGQPFVPNKRGHIYCSPRCRHRGLPGPERPLPKELLWLQLGPAGSGHSVEDLRAVWESERERVLAVGGLAGTRPWAFWAFDVGEEKPPGGQRAEALRLADLGVLRDEELAALRARAHEARSRVGTPHERFSGGGRETGVPVDVREVELWEAVAARQERI